MVVHGERGVPIRDRARLFGGEVIFQVAHFCIRDLEQPLAGGEDGLDLPLDLGGDGPRRRRGWHYRRVRWLRKKEPSKARGGSGRKEIPKVKGLC